MSRMNSAWKMVQPKAKPRTYSRIISAGPVMPRTLASTAPARMPTPSPATQCMVEPSVCRHRAAVYCSCVPGQRLATAQHVEERADDAGVGGQQGEAPFHHRRFRRRPDVDRHEQQRRRGQQEPQQHHAIQHRDLPLFASIESGQGNSTRTDVGMMTRVTAAGNARPTGDAPRQEMGYASSNDSERTSHADRRHDVCHGLCDPAA